MARRYYSSLLLSRVNRCILCQIDNVQSAGSCGRVAGHWELSFLFLVWFGGLELVQLLQIHLWQIHRHEIRDGHSNLAHLGLGQAWK